MIVASKSGTLVKALRRMLSWVIRAKNRLTWLSHEADVGVKWICSAFVESGFVAIRPAFRTEPD
jgi:hypothetical protein